MRSKLMISIASIMLWAMPVMAHDDGGTSAAGASEASSCELHIWPSGGLRSVFHGWVRGGIVDGAVNGRDGYPVIPKDPINTDKQIALLSSSPVGNLLKLSDYKPVVHDSALESRVARSTVGRINANSAPCYAELVVDDVFLQQDSFSGSHLKTFFRYRLFGDGNEVSRSFGAFTQTNLNSFPPKMPSQNAAALDELYAAFTSNIEQFGEYLNKPIKAKRGAK